MLQYYIRRKNIAFPDWISGTKIEIIHKRVFITFCSSGEKKTLILPYNKRLGRAMRNSTLSIYDPTNTKKEYKLYSSVPFTLKPCELGKNITFEFKCKDTKGIESTQKYEDDQELQMV